ncbi:MAG: FkbM family methyltransferase [Verrucomicrobiota bacterium]|jgi:FkbM family methyltransferase
MKLVRSLKGLRFWLFYHWLIRRGVPLTTLGDICKRTFSDAGLNSASRVLCAGAGNDISFEKALIARYGCKIVLLDPSPTGVATVRRENLSEEQLQFLPIGLAGEDGQFDFREPEDPAEGSFLEGQDASSGGWQFTCKSLSTLMLELGWTQIDLLKMDIEGFEYAVIQDLLEKRLDVRQICLEFHYGAGFGHSRGNMIRAILALRRAGYDLIHCVHPDHTFLRSQRK